jgi:hypothetical protein
VGKARSALNGKRRKKGLTSVRAAWVTLVGLHGLQYKMRQAQALATGEVARS